MLVEDVHPGYGGAQAGLEPGDVLTRWQRAAAPPANPSAAEGELRSQFDFAELELEQGGRGEVTLAGTRAGGALAVRMPQQAWVVSVRPLLEGDELAAYRAARSVIDNPDRGSPDHERGVAGWRELARAFRHRGRDDLASWLYLKLARFAQLRSNWPVADSAYREALAAAHGDPTAQAQIHGFAAESHEERVDWDQATAGFARALEICRARARGGLHEARVLDQLGGIAFKHGDLLSADHLLRQALDIRKAAAPESAAVANSLHNLGLVAAARGDLATAEDHFGRALALNERFAANSVDVSLTLHNLGGVAEKRGDLLRAEEYHKRALVYEASTSR